MTPPWKPAAEPPTVEGPYIVAYRVSAEWSLMTGRLPDSKDGGRYVRELQWKDGEWGFLVRDEYVDDPDDRFQAIEDSGLEALAWQPLPEWPADA